MVTGDLGMLPPVPNDFWPCPATTLYTLSSQKEWVCTIIYAKNDDMTVCVFN